jgi:multisubunit Na+/H+ antiporter MnhE subunit
VKHVAPFLLFFLTLWWLWQLLAGEWNRDEWIAGAAAAVVAAVLAELAVARTDGRAPLPGAVLKGVPSALAMVFVDFAIVMAALVRHRPGVTRTSTFPHPETEAHRTWAAIVGDWSPNAYVIDISDGTVTTHHLVEHEPSQRPA